MFKFERVRDEELRDDVYHTDNLEDQSESAAKLAGMFKENYTQYVAPGVTDYTQHGPQ